MVAPISGVTVGSLRDRQKERCTIINDEERSTEVLCPGIEGAVDIQVPLVGDGTGGGTSCNGIFIPGHTVKCDEPGTTGESDTVKKVGYDEHISSRDQVKCKGTNVRVLDATQMQTDRHLVSGCRVLEGYGKHVATALGQTTFNSHITTGSSSNAPLLFRPLTIPPVLQLLGENTITLCYKRNSAIWPDPLARLAASLA